MASKPRISIIDKHPDGTSHHRMDSLALLHILVIRYTQMATQPLISAWRYFVTRQQRCCTRDGETELREERT